MNEPLLNFILLGYALNLVAIIILFINVIITAILDYESIVELNRTNKKEVYFWKKIGKMLIPYYTAYRLFALYVMYGVKHSFNTARMVYAREKDNIDE